MVEKTITSERVMSRAVYVEGAGQGTDGGLLHVAYDHFNFARANETVSPSLVVQMCPLPDQARILDIHVRTSGFGGTGGFVVGDASLTNRFFTTTSLASASQLVKMISNGAAPASGLNYKVSLSSDAESSRFYPLLLEINGAPTATASGCIAMTVWYTVDIART